MSYVDLSMNSERVYLRQITPHRWWHTALAITGLLVAAIPLTRGFDTRDKTLVQVMATIIIALYWLFQYQILQSAIYLAKYEGQKETSYMNNKPKPLQAVIFTKVRAVLWHHQPFIILMSLMLLGLSITIMGFLYYRNYERGILQYVGIIRIAEYWSWRYPLLPHAAFVALAGALLLILTFTNSLLTISVGLWAGRLSTSLIIRFLILGVMLISFFGFYGVSASTPEGCQRTYSDPYRCPDILLRNRIVDSLQGLSLTFIDGGASVITGIYCPMGVDYVSYNDEQGRVLYRPVPTLFGLMFDWRQDGYQTRHLGVILVTYMSQLALSGFFLQLCIRDRQHDNEPLA